MEVHLNSRERNVRTLLVSDVHLGCRFAQPENFLTLLEGIRPERLYILGDFLDGWKLSSSWTWKPVYTSIFKRLLHLAEDGTELFYTPGNHDAFLRCTELQEVVAKTGVNLHVDDEFVYYALNGKRYLLTHGDKFDVIEMQHQWLSMATAVIYEPLLLFNWFLNHCFRRKQHSPYGACAVIKDRVKAAVRFLSSFESRLYAHAKNRGCSGIICGHIHSPGMVESDTVTYLNTGDWVENCTALVEYHDGSMYLESFFPDVAPRQVGMPLESSEPIAPITTISFEDDVCVTELPEPVAVG